MANEAVQTRRKAAAGSIETRGAALGLRAVAGSDIADVARSFGLSKQQLAETMGVSADALYRAERASSPKVRARAAEMLEILHRIAAWAGGEQQALAWYRAEPLPAFGDRTAESLVKEGKAAAVRDYLDHVATGGFQ